MNYPVNLLLAIANAMTGCLMMHLFWIHVAKTHEYNNEAQQHLPYDLRRNITSYDALSWVS